MRESLDYSAMQDFVQFFYGRMHFWLIFSFAPFRPLTQYVFFLNSLGRGGVAVARCCILLVSGRFGSPHKRKHASRQRKWELIKYFYYY